MAKNMTTSHSEAEGMHASLAKMAAAGAGFYGLQWLKERVTHSEMFLKM